MSFCLDTPNETEVEGITRFSGWFLNSTGQPWQEIRLLIDGRPVARPMRSKRPDVAAAFPDRIHARDAGFVGDLVFSNETLRGTAIWVAVEVDGQTIHEKHLVVRSGFDRPARPRSYDLLSLLDRTPSAVLAGTAHVQADTMPCVRLLEPGHTHGYGRQARALIDALAPDQVFLDFGAGIKRPEELLPNAVLLDYTHFPNVDVVSTIRGHSVAK